MFSLDSPEKMDRAVKLINNVSQLRAVVSKLDPNSKDIPLLFQSLDLVNKDGIVKKYAKEEQD
jgi:hypothetical protein